VDVCSRLCLSARRFTLSGTSIDILASLYFRKNTTITALAAIFWSRKKCTHRPESKPKKGSQQ